MEEPLPLLNPRNVGRVIDDIHHEDLKDALRRPCISPRCQKKWARRLVGASVQQ